MSTRNPRHTLPKLDLLQYALSGAQTERGIWSGAMEEAEEELLNADIREIERRIKLVTIANAKKSTTP